MPYTPYIPADKKLDPAWVESLALKGKRRIYSGEELKYIAMPCGGIGAGQIEIAGDGTLGSWWLFNEVQPPNGGFGDHDGYGYLHPRPVEKRIEHGFAIRIQSPSGPVQALELSRKDFDALEFIGEYPIATLNYLKSGGALPVRIQGEVFSPFIPLNVRDSANPVTVLRYSVTNTSHGPLDVAVGGWVADLKFPDEVESRAPQVSRNANSTSVQFTKRFATDEHPQHGDYALSVLDGAAVAGGKWADADEFLKIFQNGAPVESDIGSVCSHFTLAPGETRSVVFLVSWFFPNLSLNLTGYSQDRVGRGYSRWYQSSLEVARYIADNFDRLYAQTSLFRDTYFDTTLPYWLANRITMPVSTLGADNVAIGETGRMFAHEGVGFCFGTCGHVLNFATAIAKLFPELERSIRLGQDLDEKYGFDPVSGRINFRGHDGGDPSMAHAYASDAQSGYVLKIYREHLMSADRAFLDAVWPKVKCIIGYLIFQDGLARGVEPNGVLKGLQTAWDPEYYGPNPYNQTLYLAALRAAEEMARIEKDPSLADRYHALILSGQKFMNERMWNGNYYISLYPYGFRSLDFQARCIVSPAEEQANAKVFIDAFNEGRPNYFVSTACDAQQLYGQNWAHQLDLGYMLPPENCRKAAASIFTNNWAPDISTVYSVHPPKNRTLAAPGEAAMVNGSWPVEPRQDFENIHDKEDIWTGLEYQSSADMINEGLVSEALIMLRAIDDRYDAIKRNPWDEIDGSDHYVRAMHSWNILLAVSGATYDGPAGKIGFAPRLAADDFRCFFSAAQGWGSFSQKIEGAVQSTKIDLAYGKLRLNEIMLKAGSIMPTNTTVKLDNVAIGAQVEFRKPFIIIHLSNELTMHAGSWLEIESNPMT